MTNSNKKKTIQLGIPNGTAQHKLRKMITFQMIQKLGLDICFQCGEKIEKIEGLSIEHKVPWLDSDNPKKLFFDLDNIAFSHLKCNISNNRDIQHLRMKHPSINAYKRGCRRLACVRLKKQEKQRYLDNLKLRNLKRTSNGLVKI